MTPAGLESKPVCTIRVGVAGHRPNKLSAAQLDLLRGPVRQILTHIQTSAQAVVDSTKGYHHGPPVLRIVTSLAEGADRLVATEALALGCQLACPLPASREEYSRDFQGVDSLREFDRLLARAGAVFEWPGQRKGEWLEPSAYHAAAHVVLEHCDILLALWNGEPGEEGGTGQTVVEAQQSEMPIVWIQPGDAPNIVFLPSVGQPLPDWRPALDGSLHSVLAGPHKIAAPVAEFLAERVEESAATDWISRQRDRADGIAQHYARNYRRAYTLLYCLGPLAVVCSLVGWWVAAFKGWEIALTILELVCIGFIVGVSGRGRRGRWHERWMDARVLTEQFRTWAFLAPLGLEPRTARIPVYVSAKTREGDWTGWFFRALVRQYGLHSAAVSPSYLAACQRQLLQVLGEQVRHHREKGHERHRVHLRAEKWSNLLFWATGFICACHVATSLIWPSAARASETLAALTATLPAFASALEGFQAQGEYQRLSERSAGMFHYLSSLESHIARPESDPLPYRSLVQLAHQLSATMLDELNDWRNLVRFRGLRK